MDGFLSSLVVLNDRPMLKDPLSFFYDGSSNSSQEKRVFVTVANAPSVWQNDLILAERLFSEMVICPYKTPLTETQSVFDTTKQILKERMKYPGVKENHELQKIAKTWILPAKLHIGPDASEFFSPCETAVNDALHPVFTTLENTSSKVHVLKLEVGNGEERALVYKFLDSGFRPSLMLVKWSHDMDDHTPTAHCAGHLLNSGYSFLKFENEYALYIFTEQTLYDICSVKEPCVQNIFMKELLSAAAAASAASAAGTTEEAVVTETVSNESAPETVQSVSN